MKKSSFGRRVRSIAIAVAVGCTATLLACGSKEPAPAPGAAAPGAAAPSAAPSAETPPAAPNADATAAPAPGAPGAYAAPAPTSWTPEALEELLAPIALYPDPVLSQMLIASTNPQEVLDAGNWLLQNTSLKGKALDEAAAQTGFTPPLRALVQFPETVDMMCLELGWTTELGQAFIADQAGVLDAVQRLRKQAQDVGNLKSSPQMKVEKQVQEGKEVVVLKPAKPEVVYVPQYDPAAVYAPAPVVAAPAATTTTTTTSSSTKGYTGGQMVATGLLAFGAGMLVNEIFDDDDDDRRGYYYPNYGYGGMPYYPPYPYRPNYGGGFNPGYGYNRPPGYNSGFQNNGNIVINTGGNRPGNSYWDRYDNNRPGSGNGVGGNRPRQAQSPITAARPNRPELASLNSRPPRPMPADVKRPAPTATAANWKGQSGYAGAKGGAQSAAKGSPQERIANASPGYSKPPAAKPGAKAGTRDVSKVTPKAQGSYAGANTNRARPATSGAASPGPRDMAKPAPGARDTARPANIGQGDRGFGPSSSRPSPAGRAGPGAMPASRPAPAMGGRGGGNGGSALAGANRGGGGNADLAASQRGRQSLPQGARGAGAGAGGGGAQRSKR
jgi:hypothetical protein